VVVDEGDCGAVGLLLQPVSHASVSAHASRRTPECPRSVTSADSTPLLLSYTPTFSPLAPTTGSMNW